MKDSRDYGIHLINEVVKNHKFQQQIKESTLEVIKSDDIKQCSIDILKHVVLHPTTKSYVSKLMMEVFTETGARDKMIEALSSATLEAITDQATTSHIGALFTKTAGNAEVQEEAKQILINNNIFNLLTLNIPNSLGLYSQSKNVI